MKLTDLEIEHILINLELSIKESCVWVYYKDEKTTLDISYDFESDEYSEGLWLFGDKENLTAKQQKRIVGLMQIYYDDKIKATRDAMDIYNQQIDNFLDSLKIVR